MCSCVCVCDHHLLKGFENKAVVIPRAITKEKQVSPVSQNPTGWAKVVSAVSTESQESRPKMELSIYLWLVGRKNHCPQDSTTHFKVTACIHAWNIHTVEDHAFKLDTNSTIIRGSHISLHTH